METYIYKNCYDHYEKLLKNFHEKFDSKLLIAGKIGEKIVTIRKCQKQLLFLLSPNFVLEMIEEETRMKIISEGEGIKYICEVKNLLMESLFVSKTYVEQNNKYLFNIYSLSGEKAEIDKYWQ